MKQIKCPKQMFGYASDFFHICSFFSRKNHCWNVQMSELAIFSNSGCAMGGGGLVPPHPKSRQKLSKRNGIKLVLGIPLD